MKFGKSVTVTELRTGINVMDKQLLVFIRIIIGIFGISACTRSQTAPADTLLTNARIYTVNSKEPWAQALAIRSGKIIAIGSDKAIAPYQGPSTKVIDAKDHLVLPWTG